PSVTTPARIEAQFLARAGRNAATRLPRNGSARMRRASRASAIRWKTSFVGPKQPHEHSSLYGCNPADGARPRTIFVFFGKVGTGRPLGANPTGTRTAILAH